MKSDEGTCSVCGEISWQEWEMPDGKKQYTGKPLDYGECCSKECARVKVIMDGLLNIAGMLRGIGYHLTGEMVSFDTAEDRERWVKEKSAG